MAGPRPTWKGVLQISLVTIPIKVYPATESSSGLSFNQLHDDCQTRLQQKKWCPTCVREVPSAEIVKGFEFEPGKYVILRPEEFDAVAPPSMRVIDLTQFAEASALPWMAIDRAYFLLPDGPDGGPASDAYALLVEGLAGQVGIGKMAIYGREFLVAVGPQDGTLMLYTLHHAAELRTSPHIAAVDPLNPSERNLVHRVIAALTVPLDLADFVDQYQVDLRRLIDTKIAGEEIVVPQIPDTPTVGNLRDALEQSLAAVTATNTTPAKASTASPRRKRA